MIRPVLTGSTGAVGSYLAHSLICREFPVLLIGRAPRFSERARTKISAWGPVPSWDKVEFANWPGESLLKEVKKWNPTQVIHAAAETSLAATSNPEILSTNLNLLTQMMGLCHGLNIPRIDFISTAYTCGNQTGRIREIRHDSQNKFRNPYEESKWQCEELLFSNNDKIPSTCVIHRPSLVLPPAAHAREATPRALVRLFERLRMVSGREEEIRCSLNLTSDVAPGFVHLTAFIVDALQIFKKKLTAGTHIFHYSSREFPPITSWVDSVTREIPRMRITVGETCEVGKRVLGDLGPYLQNHFEFDQSQLEAELGRPPYSGLPLSEAYFHQLIRSLIRPKSPSSHSPQEALV